jgi:dihydroorotate dehydrogenase (fumarate)
MDLSTTYMGLKLKNPIVHSASPLTEHLDDIRRLEDGGASAIVMYSIFEEQITLESRELNHYLEYGTESFGEALSYFPEPASYKTGPEEYLELIGAAKRAVKIPIIGSLNGVSTGGWIDYARRIEQAGADALELNIYYIPTDPDLTGVEVVQMHVDVVSDVKKSVSIPVAVKISPFFSAMAYVAKRLADAGADALVLFNRFYQPDIDLETLQVVPGLVLSSSSELRLPLRWIAILHGRIPVDFALTTGVHTHEDVLKGLMAGAKATMVTSEILKKGPGRITEILTELTAWMERREYESVGQMLGSMSQKNCAEPAAFERANYMKALHSWRPDPTGKDPTGKLS